MVRLELVEHGHLPDGHADTWREERERVRAYVEERCWSDALRAYVEYAGADTLDAAVLRGARMRWDRVAPERLARTVDVIREHVIRSAVGMAGWVERTRDGELRLSGLADLRAYCYTVAGIVGEMLTQLFLLDAPQLERVGAYLKARATLFGEALQLVNILKDSAADRAEGRRYLPEGVDVTEVFELARADLIAASEYIAALQRESAPSGIVAFTAVPVQLAWASLAKIEKDGPGSKIGRAEVFLLIRQVEKAVERGEMPVHIPGTPERSVVSSLASLIFGR